MDNTRDSEDNFENEKENDNFDEMEGEGFGNDDDMFGADFDEINKTFNKFDDQKFDYFDKK